MSLPYVNLTIFSVLIRDFENNTENYKCFTNQREALEYARETTYTYPAEASAKVRKGHKLICEYFKNQDTMGCRWEAAC